MLQCKVSLSKSGVALMSRVEEYRRSAASLLDLAQRTDSFANKNRLLVMAEAWLDLANRATKTPFVRPRSGNGLQSSHYEKLQPRQATNKESG